MARMGWHSHGRKVLLRRQLGREEKDHHAVRSESEWNAVERKSLLQMTPAEGEDALDGLKIDQKGNLYVSGPTACGSSRQGKHLGTIVGPEHPHNFAWGDDDGKTLYLCAKTGLYRSG